MPLTLDLAHLLLRELADIRREEQEMTWVKRGRTFTYLRPDSKSQVTVEYDAETKRPVKVDTIVLSTQHDEFILPVDGTDEAQAEADRAMQARIEKDVREILIPRVKAKLPAEVAALIDDYKLYVNPTGKFVIGGPHGDTGLTGRKIIVDTYGGRGAHGGGAFSGKDPSKVDRSAAYAARHMAKNLVAAGVAREVLVQVAYAIGRAEPVSLNINTRGTALVPFTDEEIAAKVQGMECFKMTPHAIETRLKLREPIYAETAAYGHMGREPKVVTKHFHSRYEPDVTREVELFTWEKLDAVPEVKKVFGIE